MDTVNDRAIIGLGTPERDWQAWPALAALPREPLSSLVAPGQRAVVVAPHPDDEVLGFAGMLIQLARLGRDISLVAVTDGGASHPGSTRWSPPALREARREETRRALLALGVDAEVHRLGLDDGEVTAQADELRDRLRAQLQPGDVVFTTWRRDGHPDHEATGDAVAAVCETQGCTLYEVPIWTWHWASVDDPRVPWARACAIDLSEEQLERKRQAVALFTSQLQPDDSTGQAPILPPNVLARLLRDFEVLFR